MNKTSIMYFLVLVVLLLGGCQGDIDKHYERPTYLLGTTYEFLEKRGDFTLFLEAVDRAKFKHGLNGSGLFTVFAPSDDAVKTYLSKINKTSLNDLDPKELEVLVGYHIVEFSYKPDDFLGFTQTASSEKPEEADGYAHRFKTLARDGLFQHSDTVTNSTIDIFQREKFLPIISTTLLKEKRSPNYEADYRFFFPNVTWKGDYKQFYVAGSSVLESGIPADNGYVYIIDKVIEPLQTVYSAFSNEKFAGKYSVFRNLYDKFAVFEFDQEATQDYAAELGDSLFLMRHYLKPTISPDLPDIADEWTVSPDNGDFEARMRTTFNAYVPNNEAMHAFCKDYFADEELQDPTKIPMLTLFYLLSSHIPYGQEIVMPSDFDKIIEGAFGEKWPIRSADINKEESLFCSNGVFYGINTVLEPAIFSMLTEPLFKYERFSTMATLFHKTQNLLALVDVDRDYSLLLIPNDIAEEEYGLILDHNGNPSEPDILGNKIKVNYFSAWDKDETLVDLEPHLQSTFIKSQIVDGFLDMTEDGREFFATQEPFTYLYKNNRGLFYESNLPVEIETTFPSYEYEGGSGKGIVYEVKNRLEKNEENIGRALYETSKTKKFYQALLKANLITVEGGDTGITESTRFVMEWLNGERCIVFAPTNSVFQESSLPTDSLLLDKYLKCHFISLDHNKVDEYILPQLGPERKFETECAISLIEYEMLDIRYSTSEILDVRYLKSLEFDQDGNKKETWSSVYTDGDIPFFATDGLIYGIDGMLKPKSMLP